MFSHLLSSHYNISCSVLSLKPTGLFLLGLLQANVGLLVATEGENETPLIFPNFNYFWTQTSYLQDSNWPGIVSIILIEKNVFKDKAVNKSVGRGQLFMIINIFFL
jgi:hypothetical protein